MVNGLHQFLVACIISAIITCVKPSRWYEMRIWNQWKMARSIRPMMALVFCSAPVTIYINISRARISHVQRRFSLPSIKYYIFHLFWIILCVKSNSISLFNLFVYNDCAYLTVNLQKKRWIYLFLQYKFLHLNLVQNSINSIWF